MNINMNTTIACTHKVFFTRACHGSLAELLPPPAVKTVKQTFEFLTIDGRTDQPACPFYIHCTQLENTITNSHEHQQSNHLRSDWTGLMPIYRRVLLKLPNSKGHHHHKNPCINSIFWQLKYRAHAGFNM